ncbi:Serine/threonine protein phosphatase PrpC [Anaerocolumna jejuensis DSM 15929]|uniref:Serine/threonine protein phosphatase PrpC n=1 Tax=Anaerocolumna jejuensis DSM 15929 TaxID=1121322 RepID=A0A1M6V851_9FIRM|nr:protein phosphatase 2C domain-containing protein [Anaerocolumna jejuensis]SHK77618.1 Serine/threonine protein phosphatase PrpC [Anaerocolumna jejuensis DSM 15929]
MMIFYDEDKLIQFAYSERGKHHIDLGQENQDSVYVGKVINGTYCVVVADGVSSCKWAKKGSEAAVDTVKNLAMKMSLGEIAVNDKNSIRRFVVTDWKSHFESKWNDYGTTLNFVIICNQDLVIGQIGDGLVLITVDDENILVSDMDEFYSVETYALAEAVLKSSFNIICKKIKGNVVAVAMTDGIGKELDLDTIDEFKNYLVELIKGNTETREKEIASWMKHLREKNDDDKSLGILVLEGWN